MQKSKIFKVRENVKSYNSPKAGGNLYVHAVTFEGDPVEYEHHSKTQQPKYKPGEELWYEVTTDNYGNKKIKPCKAPEPSVQYQSAFNQGPINVPPVFSTGISYNDAWLRIFQGICSLKTGQATLVDVIKHTDELAERFK